MRLNYIYIIAIVILGVTFSCSEKIQNQKGSIQFIVSGENTASNLKSSFKNDSLVPSFIHITIEDKNGNVVENQSTLTLSILNFNNYFISEPLAKTVGEYNLVEFLVLDSAQNVIYASPLENSEYAQLVNKPLPLSFSVSVDEVSKIQPEVIATYASDPGDFGYASFSFDAKEVIGIMMGVLAYDIEQQNYKMIPADIKFDFSDHDSIVYSLENKTSVVHLPIFQNYVHIHVDGAEYGTFNDTLSFEELSEYSLDSGKVFTVLVGQQSQQKRIVMQPGPDESKDANLWSSRPNENRGDYYFIEAMAWTWSGQGDGIGNRRNLIDFDWSAIPAHAEIISAKLYLYHSDIESPMANHSKLSGSNESVLQRVIEPWEEDVVTWNNQPSTTEINEVLVPESNSVDENYEIDVTPLVKDILNDLNNSHGFMLKLLNEAEYRALVFSSSDTENPDIRPKIEILYE